MSDERALWLAVIDQAVTDAQYTGNDKYLRRERDDALKWLQGCPDLEVICSFASVSSYQVRKRGQEIARALVERSRTLAA